MKRLILTVMICLGCIGILAAQNVWKPINIPGTLKGVAANGDLFIGETGIQRSQDEGETWQVVLEGTYYNHLDGFTISPNGRIFDLPYNQYHLCISDDGGDTWRNSPDFLNSHFENAPMYAVSDDTLFVKGGDILYWTLDGGESWNETPIDFVGDALFGSILADHTGNVYVSTYSWTYPADQVGIYTATLDDMTHWTVKTQGGARDMAFDSQGNILAASPWTFYYDNGVYFVNADRFAVTDDDVIFAMKRLDNYSESLFYSTNHGETYTQYGESIPQSHGAPDPDLGLFKGHDNHLYIHAFVWDRDEETYYKSIRDVDRIVNPNIQYQQGWQELQTGVSEDLFGIYCISQTQVVACGENGKILKTSDGGRSWDVVYEKPGYDMIHIAFSSSEVGYACGDSCTWDEANHKGIIVKTTDGGATWNELPNTEFVSLDQPSWTQNNKFVVLPYYNESLLYLFDDNGILWSSDDSGQTFTSHQFDFGRVDYCELFMERGYDYIGGCLLVADVDAQFQRRLHVFITLDGGATWTEKLTLDCESWHQFVAKFYAYYLVELYGYFNNGENNLLITNDGFDTYFYTNTESDVFDEYAGDFTRAKFSDPYDCVLMGRGLNKGSTEWFPIIIENGWWLGECEMNHLGIPYCYNDGMTHCRDLNCIDGLGSTFFIASEEGLVYKNGMVPVGGTIFPNSSEWYYEIQNENGTITYQYMYQAGDTIVQDEPTHILVKINTLYDKDVHTEETHEYVYERDGKLYWWNKTLEEFTVLYDLGAQEGDSWVIKVGTETLTMLVDAVFYTEYEGISYRTLRVSDADGLFSGDIVCGIGHLTSFFPERLMDNGDGIRVEGLRCYWVEDELVFKYGDEDCDAIYDELHGIEEGGPSTPSTGSGTAGTFAVYPNPTNGVLFVETRRATSLPAETYHITNLVGQTVLSGNINAENQQINVSSLPQGMYFITFAGETQKFVVR